MQQGALEPLIAECEREEQAARLKRLKEEEREDNSYDEAGSDESFVITTYFHFSFQR